MVRAFFHMIAEGGGAFNIQWQSSTLREGLGSRQGTGIRVNFLEKVFSDLLSYAFLLCVNDTASRRMWHRFFPSDRSYKVHRGKLLA